MSKGLYSDRQIEVANILKSAGGDIPSQVVEEILDIVGSEDTLKTLGDSAWRDKVNAETLLRIKIVEEADWKKKAALTAMLISRSFD